VRRHATALAAASLLLLGAAAPASAQRDVPPAFFGVNYDAHIADHATPAVADGEFRLQARSGVETTRVVFSWNKTQPLKDEPPDWSRIDAVVTRASRQGIDLLPVVIEAPPWARERRQVYHSPPKHPRLMAGFFELLIERYGPSGDFWALNPDVPRRPLRTWQVWNEPHLPFQWDSRKPWARPYGSLLRWSYKAIKRSDRGARVVMAGLSNTSWKYLDELYRKGRVRRHFDVAALHPYTSRARGVIVLARRFRTVMRRNRDGRRALWITELGLPASRGREDSDNRLQTTDEGMADFLTTAVEKVIAGRRSRNVRVSRVYWYTWASIYCCGDIFRYNGLREYDPGSQALSDKPAYSAYVDAARRHQGCVKTETAVCEPEPAP
jgi:polysaccharide biosynthesis protein PslG